jgi:hypothetical protein
VFTAHDTRPLYPVGPEPLAGGSDQRLAASLRVPSWATDPYPLAALLGRHWEPVYDYAALCAASTGSSAGALAAAAVHQVFRSLQRSGPVAALRPRLLMAVRDIAEAWAVDPDASPGPPGAGTGAGASRTGDRRLALLSFTSLPATAQCLLWHTVVEAEPVSVPAALLALDIGAALTELQEAREQFRTGLLRAHTELAGHAACRFYSRLLDTQTRRRQAFLPDVQHHLLACPHCAAAALQLGLFERRLGLLMAQAVLGGPAQDYLASRPGRRLPGGVSPALATGADEPAAAPRQSRGRRPGRHRLVPGVMPPAAAAPPRIGARALLAGASLASVLALGTVLATVLWPSAPAGTGSAVPDDADISRTESGASGPATAPGSTSAALAPGSPPPAGLSPAGEGTQSLFGQDPRGILRQGEG